MNKTVKPKRLLILGWGWLIFGIVSLLEMIPDVLNVLNQQEQMRLLITNPPPELANTVEFFTPIYRFLPLLAFFKIFLVVTTIVVAVNFIRLKKWARILLEMLSWAMVLLIILFAWYTVNYSASLAADGHKFNGLRTTLTISFLCSLVFLLSGWQLRSKKIASMFQINNTG